MTLWYRIENHPNYRVNMFEEVLSLHRIEPRVMKPAPDGTVLLRTNGKYYKVKPKDLLKKVLRNDSGEAEPDTKPLKTHCKNNHEFTEENTMRRKGVNRDGSDIRKCKTCHRESMRRYREALAAHWKTSLVEPAELEAWKESVHQ